MATATTSSTTAAATAPSIITRQQQLQQLQPVLRTERLVLRPLGPEHFEYTRQLDFDPDVMRYVLTGKPLTPEQAVEVHQWLMDAAKPVPGLGCWVGFIDEDFVGWWVLAPSQTNLGEDGPAKYNPERAEFGWRLLPRFWRKGYAKEGSRELLRHAFQDLGLNEVAGDTMAINVASRATMASCGLKQVRTFYNQYDDPIPGIEEGEVEYRITRDEWLALQRPVHRQLGHL
ncbi:hypothetical protein PV08_09780 [Exophiala spinifera]|uniref:N-acetyltransferase domain-containing protein n=1 Tax=Exophiala spinifera TaxID=91928 RepID=A0A0D2B0V2_9EURO|nr:uncharacterized protein PV08_09780 [Exophiala spinifera]KIW12503.1 hypothetical protein PV08_09780 [Exophiala spinifera]